MKTLVSITNIVAVINVMLQPRVMKLSVYIMPRDPTSTMHFIIPFTQ
jgi:hypothetical protein